MDYDFLCRLASHRFALSLEVGIGPHCQAARFLLSGTTTQALLGIDSCQKAAMKAQRRLGPPCEVRALLHELILLRKTRTGGGRRGEPAGFHSGSRCGGH